MAQDVHPQLCHMSHGGRFEPILSADQVEYRQRFRRTYPEHLQDTDYLHSRTSRATARGTSLPLSSLAQIRGRSTMSGKQSAYECCPCCEMECACCKIVIDLCPSAATAKAFEASSRT